MKNSSTNQEVAVGWCDGYFGRWRDMPAWRAEVEGIVEKPIDSCAADTVPISGNWSVTVEIPSREVWRYGEVMEAVLALLIEIGSRPVDAYVEGGFCTIQLKRSTFCEAKFRAEKIRNWLIANGYGVKFGEYLPWAPVVPARIQLTRDARIYPTESEWQGNDGTRPVVLVDIEGNHRSELSQKLRRAAARTSGSDIALRSNEVHDLLAILVKASTECLIIENEIQDRCFDETIIDSAARQTHAFLCAIGTKLWTALDNVEKSKPTAEIWPSALDHAEAAGDIWTG
jgi:hypothetical protein